MALLKENPKLLNFFIFNSKFGQKEGSEEEKIIFYYPENESLDSQVRNVSLAEAITRFTSTFNKDDDCDSLHTQKTHQVFYQAEPNIWITLTFAVGWVQKEKECGLVKEYHGEEVQDKILKSHLIHAYKCFKFSHFNFSHLLENENIKNVKDILSQFFVEYISERDFTKGSILNIWSGVSFLPLDKQAFLRVYCSLSHVQTTFPSIVHIAFMYKEAFAWCGFSLEDFEPLSDYLNRSLSRNRRRSFTSSLQLTSPSLTSSSHTIIPQSLPPQSRFIDGHEKDSKFVYLRDKRKVIQPHQLLIYQLADVCIAMSFNAKEDFSLLSLNRLSRSLDSTVSHLTGDIEEQLSQKTPHEFRFLYHNRMNLATKSSIRGVNELPSETMQTIVDMHSDLLSEKSSELIVKTAFDNWVVGRSGNGRESFIVVISPRNANLVEVTDEVNRLCDSQFNSVFMTD